MNAKDIQQMRASRVHQIKRTRLGGADRITVDEPFAEYARYAHIMENGSGTNLHTTDDPTMPDPAYTGWRRVGVIDLDTGDLVNVSAE